ncbi:MAG: hypothetical protein GKR90_24355 [Pseudomonadales bacterium]|nr:hypothetical protein [Pseudomonadales bacterium]
MIKQIRDVVAALGILLLTGSFAHGNDYVDEWGPAVGTPMPLLAATDQTGQARTFDDLAGENGLLIFVNRSADW